MAAKKAVITVVDVWAKEYLAPAPVHVGVAVVTLTISLNF